jgi:quinol monooxygenase YgiN
MSVTVVATIFPLPEHRSEVISAFEKVIAKVHAEDAGCHLYALHEGDDRLVMIEKWESQDALDSHSAGPAVAELGPQLAGKLVTAPDLQVLRPHPAGSAEQGVL